MIKCLANSIYEYDCVFLDFEMNNLVLLDLPPKDEVVDMIYGPSTLTQHHCLSNLDACLMRSRKLTLKTHRFVALRHFV